MTEQEEKMWAEDLDMIAKLNKEVDELHNKIDKAIEILEEVKERRIMLLDEEKVLEILKGKE